VDRVTASSVNGGNFNRYWYANNNPYRFTDPDGRMVQDRWRDQMGDRMQRGPFDNPCGQPVCLSAGSGGEKKSRSSEEDEYYAERAQMVRRGKETFEAAGKTVATEAGWMAAGGPVSKFLGKVGRYIGFAGKESKWVFGAGKSEAKWAAQMERRGWNPGQITEAVGDGARFPAENLINKGNSATRYVHPGTGRSVVLDDVTREVIHVGGEGFKY
jgi:hypothetical protein